MRVELLRHRPRGNYAYPVGPGEAEIMLETGKDDCERVLCTYFDQYLVWERPDCKEKTIEMEKVSSGEYLDAYRCRVKPPRNRLGYYFTIYFKSGEVRYFNELGVVESAHAKDLNQFTIPYLNIEDAVVTPDWVKTAVCYQIFPDSFAKEDGELDFNTLDKDNQYRFAGGTLKGIMKKIPYLKQLGINCIYTTPIFKANTNHRYETVDYYEIDPRLGTKEDFKSLVDELHRNGIRIILDGVFNHTSSHFFAFSDILKNQEKSIYKDWYDINRFPVDRDIKDKYKLAYETFATVADMPKLNTCNKEVTDYIIGVVSYWTKEFKVDGWRLDVANEIPLVFWRKFREALKEINPDTYIIGESWNDSNCYLQGDTFDGVMNYLFRNYTFRLFDHENHSKFSKGVGYDIHQFISKYNEHLVQYPKPIFDTLMNLIGSHDVERVRDNFKDERIVRCLTALQLTLSGMPCIYYGDEMGLQSDKVYGNRAGVKWDSINNEVLSYYKKLIELRNENKALSIGKVSFDESLAGVLKYTKQYEDNKLVIFINISNNEVEIPNMENYDEVFNTNLGTKSSLRSYDIKIYKEKGEK